MGASSELKSGKEKHEEKCLSCVLISCWSTGRSRRFRFELLLLFSREFFQLTLIHRR